MREDKVKKVRTSITIDPDVLQRIREVVEADKSRHKSVAHFLEAAALLALNMETQVDCQVDSNV